MLPAFLIILHYPGHCVLQSQSKCSFHFALQDHAYPADELMPLSCKGRVRGVDPSRGDVDDALGK